MIPPERLTRWGVVVFPGSNCDHDALDVLGRLESQDVRPLWHREASLDGIDGVVLPGGFSYGDYLRAGAIARFSPVMAHLPDFVAGGGLTVGICNGFQILTELGILPGALARNAGLRFICRVVYLRVERTDTPFTSRYTRGQVIRIPIAHNEGKFFLSGDELDRLEQGRQVVFRYCDAAGRITDESNPNGSVHNIAGIVNERGNVLGMMPHPERRCDPLLGANDGEPLFRSMISHLLH